jgi:hypothetical protein
MNDTWAGFQATTNLAEKTIVMTTFVNPALPQAYNSRRIRRLA